MTRLLSSFTLALVLSLGACSESADGGSSSTASPENFVDEPCAACGMFVHEQPSPRGQVVHRDGTREYFCAIADMLAYLEAPSPHGEAVGIYVETLAPDAEPSSRDATARPWLPAAEAGYVIGIERSVMGEPVMSFATAEQARAAATRLSARALDWAALRTQLTRSGDGDHRHSEPSGE